MMRPHLSTSRARFSPLAYRQDVAEDEPLFSPTLRHAIESETHMRMSRGFDAQFFAKLDEKRARSRTFQGQIERFAELEISGVAVWRLLGSGAAGSVFPALVLACCLSTPVKNAAPVPFTPLRIDFSIIGQRRFWEEEAWKNPFRAFNFSLLDPHFNLGGASCDSCPTA